MIKVTIEQDGKKIIEVKGMAIFGTVLKPETSSGCDASILAAGTSNTGEAVRMMAAGCSEIIKELQGNDMLGIMIAAQEFVEKFLKTINGGEIKTVTRDVKRE